MSRKSKKEAAAASTAAGLGKHARKELAKKEKRFQELEHHIDEEFRLLVTTESYDWEELNTLRWDYRLDYAKEFKLTEEDIQYFVAKKEGRTLALPPGAPQPMMAAYAYGSDAYGGQLPTGEYVRMSDVDIALIEKHLERKIRRDSAGALADLYKEATGEDLVVPEKYTLVDLTYPTRDIRAQHKAGKLSKAEILGGPEEKPAQATVEPKAEAKVEAPRAVRRESKALAVALAVRRGVPRGPTYDERWHILNPFRFWVLPKRLAGNSVWLFYILIVLNLVIFIGQFAIILIPFVIRSVLFGLVWIKRIVAPKVGQKLGPKFRAMQEKAQKAAGTPAEAPKSG